MKKEHFLFPALQFLLTTNRVLQNFGNIYSKDDMIFHHLSFQDITPEITIHLYFLWTLLFANLPSYLLLEL